MSAICNYRKYILLISISFMMSFSGLSQLYGEYLDPEWINEIAGQHDMSLPDWGPYTKRYIGVSHLPEKGQGLRFDLSVFPGYYRGQTTVPNVMFESDFYPWEASPDLSYFSFRHMLEWKDKVYADISYSEIDQQSRLVRAELVNNTELPQNLVLHMMASMNFPPKKEYAPDDPIYPADVSIPAGTKWIDALKYDDIEYVRKDARYDLVYDGKMRGEVRGDDFVNGSGLGRGFGETEGDNVSYSCKLVSDIAEAHLLIRYRMGRGNKTMLHLGGVAEKDVQFSGDDELEVKNIPLGRIAAGEHKIILTALGGKSLELDGFVIVSANDVDKVLFKTHRWDYKPEIVKGPAENSLLLKYKDTDTYYGLMWSAEQYQVREYFCKELDILFAKNIHNHVSSRFNGEGDGHFTNIFMRPIEVEQHSHKVIYAIVITGSRSDVEQRLKKEAMSTQECEAIYTFARNKLSDMTPVKLGQEYEFSQQRMAATLLTNVVYPVYTQNSYIKHYAPGRWWDCLYTWDSGFIGLGLVELDIRRALECLNTYVTNPGDQSAFIHHGSMVPVQHYLFMDIWNRTQSRVFLEYYYPRLKQYYEFFIGRIGSSTMDKFDSGLLSSFDYFYNSGGWDDYPAQKYTHDKRLGGRMAPVVNSAQAIRISKIMVMAANELGRQDDIAVYKNDIERLSDALQKYSWDQESGYYGYVQHDDNNMPVSILKNENNVSCNMGMDGVYPLVAGIGSSDQKDIMLERLMDPDRLWSKAGLSAVDQSAPYYRNDGYWNGTVWMPHQWFFWKALLDMGQGDFAWEVARKALDVWETEVGASYNCKEHFLIDTGRGAGWHQFGALSSPVLKWYSAYCRPGTLTAGFNVWIENEQVSADNTLLEARLRFCEQDGKCSLVVCMNPGYDYSVKWNGRIVDAQKISDGVLNVSLAEPGSEGQLVVSVLH